jgi:DNA polymerase-3 subunit gamma/tau
MPSQALYRKWRSRTFEDLVAQEHVTHTLANAVRGGRIAHAYLFTGPRGTGKTSTARLLAKAVNCAGPEDGPRPCNQCPTCLAIDESRLLDLIEIDAASNRGIDEIRDLREKVNFRPSDARYKVYVIDEVHMLTNEAFNALLKTLEEPPGHVIFVLATTEPHKIPATVLSRCQRFDFGRIPLDAIVGRLRYIAGQENIQVEEEALEFIARQATGSLRDAVSLLDQLASCGGATVLVEQVRQILGLVPHQMVRKLAGCLVEEDIAGGLATIAEAIENGADPYQLSRELVEYLRGLLLVKMSGSTTLVNLAADEREVMNVQAERLDVRRLVTWIKAFNEASLEMRLGTHLQLPLELALVSVLIDEEPTTPGAAPRAGVLKPKPPPESRAEGESETEVVPDVSGSVVGQPVTLEVVKENWGAVLAEIISEGQTGSHRMVHALLESSQPVMLKDDELAIGFGHDALATKMADPSRVSIAQDSLEKVLGMRFRVKCVVISKEDSTGGLESGTGTELAENAPSSSGANSRRVEVTVDDKGTGQAKTGSHEEFDDIIAGDRLIREAVEKFGARVSDVQVLDEHGGES